MIEDGIGKVAGRMTYRALLLRWQVTVVLADSNHSVMASIAAADVTAVMVKHAAGESARCVAKRAIFAGHRQMIKWHPHSRVTMAAVTAFTHYCRAAVVDKSSSKTCCVMAGCAIYTVYIWMVAGTGHPRCIDIVVAGGTGLRY